MSQFPKTNVPKYGDYFSKYMETLHEASQSISHDNFQEMADTILRVFNQNGILYVCGNGGSAAISNHMVCDVMKGMRVDSNIQSRIISLANNIETITAIANDIDYSEVFSMQLKAMAKSEDILMTISSSGNSTNILKAIKCAKNIGIPSISLTGFDGGESAKMADINIHVPIDNYGIVEDIHQSVMHSLAQYLRQSQMPKNMISERVF